MAWLQISAAVKVTNMSVCRSPFFPSKEWSVFSQHARTEQGMRSYRLISELSGPLSSIAPFPLQNLTGHLGAADERRALGNHVWSSGEGMFVLIQACIWEEW